MIIAVNFPASAAGKKKPEKKNQGFNGIRNRDLHDTDVMLYQLSYEASHLEWGQVGKFAAIVILLVVSFPARYNYFNVFLCFGHVIFEFSGFGHEILSFAFSFFV